MTQSLRIVRLTCAVALAATVAPARAATTHLSVDGQVAMSQVAAAEGRIGIPGAGDFEMDLGPSTSAPASHAQLTWISGVPKAFSLTFDAGANTLTFVMDGVALPAYAPAGPIEDLFLRTRAHLAGTSITVDSLVLDGVAVGDQSSAPAQGLDILWIGDAGLADGFTLAGAATMTFAGAPVAPTRSKLAFQIGLGVADGCLTAAQCDDGNACTIDQCGQDFACTNVPDEGCVACETDADCADDDRCTDDVCAEGVCTHPSNDVCAPPSTTTTTTTTTTTLPDEVPTTTTTVPEDGGSTTTTTTLPGDGGSTTTTTVPGRPSCDDDREPTAEVCGDCSDNDGDGLVDYEDPDCCTVAAGMDMQLRIRPIPLHRKRLALRATQQMATAEPTRHDTTVQLRDETGTFYCETLPASMWKRRRNGRLYTFHDRTGTIADGLRRAQIRMKQDGQVTFGSVARYNPRRTPGESRVQLTLRVGDQCFATGATLVRKGRGMVTR